LNIEQINKINIFLNYEATLENLEWIKDILQIKNNEFNTWISELKEVLEFSYTLWIEKNNLKINLAITRGLTYYTGTVFETFIEGDRKLGSIGSGWRYEKLTKGIDIKTNFSWVGFSVWVTRLEDYLFENITSEYLPETTSEYLIVNFEDTVNDSLNLYNKLIQEWKNVEYYPENEKLSKQFKYADKKKIKYCVILWNSEREKWIYILKDLFNGTSKELKL